MKREEPKIVVISAVNIVVGGTLTILRDCLKVLSDIAVQQNLKVIALVHSKELAEYDNIEYIEMKWPKKLWINRLWTEYVSMKKISKGIGPVYLWFSLHDTTPTVIAEHRAVYCHNSFSFYKWRFSDIFNNYKIVLFALFTKYIYKKNTHKNDYVIVQQPWFKDEFVNMFGLKPEKIILAYPNMEHNEIIIREKSSDKYQFFFPSSLGVHKNFELVCKATSILTGKGITGFEVLLTLDGSKSKYDSSIVNRYKKNESIQFIGFQTYDNMLKLYGEVDCLIFPSKMESWGLPISEFATTGKAMLLSDLAYARTAAEGSKQTAFFDPNNAAQLAAMMEKLIDGDKSDLAPVEIPTKEGIVTNSWGELLDILLK